MMKLSRWSATSAMKNYLFKDQGVCDKSQVKETSTHLQL